MTNILEKVMFEIKIPRTQKDFDDYYDLRWRILRKPWNQPEGSEKDEFENQCHHVMVCDENKTVVGTGRLQFLYEQESQNSYMAVEPRHASQGIGKIIVNALEKHAAEKNRLSIILNAREPVVGFYEKLGYEVIERSYLLFNSIQHYKMVKTLLR
jgi:predicted GNAT family N-acyltransferase